MSKFCPLIATTSPNLASSVFIPRLWFQDAHAVAHVSMFAIASVVVDVFPNDKTDQLVCRLTMRSKRPRSSLTSFVESQSRWWSGTTFGAQQCRRRHGRLVEVL